MKCAVCRNYDIELLIVVNVVLDCLLFQSEIIMTVKELMYYAYQTTMNTGRRTKSMQKEISEIVCRFRGK